MFPETVTRAGSWVDRKEFPLIKKERRAKCSLHHTQYKQTDEHIYNFPLASCLWWLTNLINQRFSLLISHIGLPYFITIFSLVPAISLTTFIPHISFHLLRTVLNLPSYTPHIEEDISLNIPPSLILNMNSRPGNKKVTETYLNISRRIVKLWNVT
jgi:hypothetical protein